MLYLDYSRKAGEWVPNVHGGNEDLDAIAFLKQLNEVAHGREPGLLMAAEESTAWPGVSRPVYLGGLGFGLKWNMGWMHDTLAYFQRDPVYRRHHHHQLTFSLVYAFSENFVLPLSHDEVVHGKGSLLAKMPGDPWQQRANLRALFAYMWAHPGKKLLFMGGELGQESEWRSEGSLDWHLLERPEHSGIQSLVRDLNLHYRDEPALWEVDFESAGFRWLEPNDAAANVLVFMRLSKDGDRQARLRLQLLAGGAPGLPGRATPPRPLARARQHRFGALRRLGRGEPGRRHRGGEAVARPALLGRGHAAAAGRGLAGTGVTTRPPPAAVGRPRSIYSKVALSVQRATLSRWSSGQLLLDLYAAFHKSGLVVDRACAGTGIEPEDFAFVSIVGGREPVTPTAISREFGLSLSTVLFRATRNVELGLVERVTESAGREIVPPSADAEGAASVATRRQEPPPGGGLARQTARAAGVRDPAGAPRAAGGVRPGAGGERGARPQIASRP